VIKEVNIFYVGEEAILSKRAANDEKVLMQLSNSFREGRRVWVIFPLIKEDESRVHVKELFDKFGNATFSIEKERAWVYLYQRKR
jgi:RecG-like helicase